MAASITLGDTRLVQKAQRTGTTQPELRRSPLGMTGAERPTFRAESGARRAERTSETSGKRSAGSDRPEALARLLAQPRDRRVERGQVVSLLQRLLDVF